MTDSIVGVLLAGISYDPEIRGVLVVTVAALILIGSVYLLLSTNVGARLGFQVAMAGLFGWLMLLSLFWWIYGVGAIGTLPSWRVEEINVGDLSQAQLEEARGLVPENLPSAEDIIAEFPEVAEAMAEDPTPTLSEIAALPDLPPEVEEELTGLEGGWDVLSQAAIGDAQAAADTALISEDTGLYTSASEYVLVDGFTRGGKEQPESDSLWDRMSTRVANAFTVLNPPKYTVIQVQTSESTAVPEGNAPLSPTPDEDQPVVSVIMVRDLGTRRLPPAMLTILFGSLFALTCALLHSRDRRAQALSTVTAGD
ncbi:MAG: hypothetical protein ABWZ55_05955 [Acidimicrobiales bacterium]